MVLRRMAAAPYALSLPVPASCFRSRSAFFTLLFAVSWC